MYELFTDGSAKYGVGYFGYVLFKNKEIIDYGYGRIGQDIKPRIAEKYALLYGLNSFVRKMDDKLPLKVFGDAKQLIETAENDPDVNPVITRIRDYGIPVVLKWISRDRNILANDLARKMIVDSRMAESLPENSKG